MSSIVDDKIAYNLRSRKIVDRHSNRWKKPRLQNKENEKPKGWFPPGDVDANFWKKLCIPSLLQQQFVVVGLAGVVDEESSALYSWIADDKKRRQGKVVGDEEMWKYWANRALEHYNKNFVSVFQKAYFRLLEVTRVLTDCKKIHINFKATESDNDDDASSKLFFAELIVINWNVPDNIIVTGSCILQQVDSGDLDARPCSLCGDADLIHPTARYGHRSASGDAFARELW